MKCNICGQDCSIGPGDAYCGDCGHSASAHVALSPTGEIRRFEGHLNPVLSVAFSPDGSRALSGSVDGTVRAWEVDTGRLLWFSSKHWSWVDSVAFSPRGDYAVSSGADGWARIWNAENGQEIRRLPASSMLIQSVAFSPDGRFLLIGGEDPPYIRLWDIESGREVRSFMGHTAAVRRAVISPDGQHVLSLGQDSTLRWWDLASGSQLRMIALGGCYLDPLASSVAIAPDGHRAVSCNLCAEVDVWDLDTGLRIRELVGHEGNVYEAVFSPDGRRIISCGGTDYMDAASLGPQGKDNSIRVWDAESGTEIACLKGHGGNVNSVAVSPDGRYLLSGGNDMTVRLWNMPAAGLAAASRSAGLTA